MGYVDGFGNPGRACPFDCSDFGKLNLWKGITNPAQLNADFTLRRRMKSRKATQTKVRPTSGSDG